MGTWPDLSGQVAVVTGAGRGIGRAVAIALAAHGAKVAVLARTRNEIDETVSLIASCRGSATAFVADIAVRADVLTVFAQIERELGSVNLLVNNAGALGPLGPFVESDIAEWWRVNEVNVLGPALCSQAVLPGMIARRAGRIVTVASGGGTNTIRPFFSAYIVSKTAAVRFAEALALEVKDYGIVFSRLGRGRCGRPCRSGRSIRPRDRNGFLGFARSSTTG